MYQILICTVLYSIVAKKKVWIALEKFFLLFRRELKSSLGKDFPSAGQLALGIHRALPSVPSLALGKS